MVAPSSPPGPPAPAVPQRAHRRSDAGLSTAFRLVASMGPKSMTSSPSLLAVNSMVASRPGSTDSSWSGLARSALQTMNASATPAVCGVLAQGVADVQSEAVPACSQLVGASAVVGVRVASSSWRRRSEPPSASGGVEGGRRVRARVTRVADVQLEAVDGVRDVVSMHTPTLWSLPTATVALLSIGSQGREPLVMSASMARRVPACCRHARAMTRGQGSARIRYPKQRDEETVVPQPQPPPQA